MASGGEGGDLVHEKKHLFVPCWDCSAITSGIFTGMHVPECCPVCGCASPWGLLEILGQICPRWEVCTSYGRCAVPASCCMCFPGWCVFPLGAKKGIQLSVISLTKSRRSQGYQKFVLNWYSFRIITIIYKRKSTCDRSSYQSLFVPRIPWWSFAALNDLGFFPF